MSTIIDTAALVKEYGGGYIVDLNDHVRIESGNHKPHNSMSRSRFLLRAYCDNRWADVAIGIEYDPIKLHQLQAEGQPIAAAYEPCVMHRTADGWVSADLIAVAIRRAYLALAGYLGPGRAASFMHNNLPEGTRIL